MAKILTNFTPDTLDYYKDYQLIPLKHAEIDPDDWKEPKRPKENDWPRKKYSAEDIEGAIADNRNLGVALQGRQAVLDVDPRGGGDDSLALIAADTGFPVTYWGDNFMLALTGGDGFHAYGTIPEKFNGVSFRTKLSKYPGIDFKYSTGHQVVAVGSMHPSGKLYEFDPLCPMTPGVFPDAIVELFRRSNAEEPSPDALSTLGSIKPEQLKMLLDQLDPTKFRCREDWLQLLFSCHYITNGHGRDVWVDWATSDTKFEAYEHVEENVKTWNTTSTRKAKPATGKVLYYILNKHGGVVPWEKEDLLADFDEVEADRGFRCDALIHRIQTTDKKELSEPMVLRAIAFDAARLGGLYPAMVKIEYKDHMGRGFSREVDTAFAKAQRKIAKTSKAAEAQEAGDKPDIPKVIAERALTLRFNDGKYLLHAVNQVFYFFNGKYWELLKDNAVKQILWQVAEEILEEGELKFTTSHNYARALGPLSALVTTTSDVFGPLQPIKSIINCMNWELHIDPKTGDVKAKKHNHESYMLNVLDVDYVPTATCPLMDQTLREIFANARNTTGLIEHFWELIGYAIQPYKPEPVYVVLLGDGANGKSALMHIIRQLVGMSAFVPKSISQFSTKSNNHAYASLPGALILHDDEVECGALLPDAVLKNISQNIPIEINPKGKDAYSILSTITAFLSANTAPPIRDTSLGFRRRAHVLPFERIFGVDEQDSQRAAHIIEGELPGVLNRALDGLKRVRQRDNKINLSTDSERALGAWLKSANNVIAWRVECTVNDLDDGIESLERAFENYQNWARSVGGPRPYGKNDFTVKLGQLEGVSINDGQVYGIRIVKDVNSEALGKGFDL